MCHSSHVTSHFAKEHIWACGISKVWIGTSFYLHIFFVLNPTIATRNG